MKKYIDKDKLQEFATKLTAKYHTLFSSPLVASTAAEMTDTTKVYVYTGSESGYTSGNWYYYDGSAWQSGGVYNAVAVETDTTLSISGKAADAKVVGDRLIAVETELFEASYTDEAEQTFTASYNDQVLASNGWTATLSGWYVSQAFAIPDGATHIKANYTTDFENTSQTRCAVDFYSTSSVGTSIVGYYRDVVSGEYLEIPEGASYVRFSYQDATTEHFCFSVYATMNAITEMQKDISTLEQIITVDEYTETTSEEITPNWTTGFVEPSNGQIYTGGTYDNFIYSQKISVEQGDTIRLWNVETNAYTVMRTITAYDGENLKASAGVGSDSSTYTVPADVDGIIITRVNNGYTYKIYHEHYDAIEKANIKLPKLGYMRSTGDIGDGESLELPEHNVKHDGVTAFTCRITSFDSIKIGKNISGTPYAIIDDTNIVLTNSSTSVTVAHGLTIADDLQVIIETQQNTKLKRIVVSSHGNDYVYNSDFGWLDDQGEPYVTSIGSTLTDCVLSWTSRHINKPIWIFGDSYISYANNRWAYYLIQDGYLESCMLNGFSGEASTKAYAALANLLTATVPKMVVWCIGMNNGDTESAVNSTWKEYYDKIINLSKKYGFELILYTTPTTPDVNNNFKNAIVRASGYRYVDVDGALKADDNGNWISGTLYSDNVHPTVQGAKVIYHRFLADLPELTSK